MAEHQRQPGQEQRLALGSGRYRSPSPASHRRLRSLRRASRSWRRSPQAKAGGVAGFRRQRWSSSVRRCAGRDAADRACPAARRTGGRFRRPHRQSHLPWPQSRGAESRSATKRWSSLPSCSSSAACSAFGAPSQNRIAVMPSPARSSRKLPSASLAFGETLPLTGPAGKLRIAAGIGRQRAFRIGVGLHLPGIGEAARKFVLQAERERGFARQPPAARRRGHEAGALGGIGEHVERGAAPLRRIAVEQAFVRLAVEHERRASSRDCRHRRGRC